MKIKKKGNSLVAYRDENDVNNPNMNDRIKIGDSLGSINIKTEKFIGNTVCLKELTEKRDEYLDSLIDRVIEQVKKDVADGDLTVVDELLRFIPIKNLIQSLPEEEWKEFM